MTKITKVGIKEGKVSRLSPVSIYEHVNQIGFSEKTRDIFSCFLLGLKRPNLFDVDVVIEELPYYYMVSMYRSIKRSTEASQKPLQFFSYP